MVLEIFFVWQARYLVNLDDMLKGSKVSKVSFCEALVLFDFGHDDDCVWPVQNFGCLMLIFRCRRYN